jgi:uridine phosphorylase
MFLLSMSKLLKAMKVKILNLGLNFLSIDEKIAYIAFKTKSNYVKPIVILPTGQNAMKKLKTHMKDPRRIGNLLNGTINGVKVSVIRAGMGGPHVALVMEGLKRSPCKVAIRLDYCGGLKSVDETLEVADIVIPKEVFLTDGTSHSYLQTYSEETEKILSKSYPQKKEDKILYPSLNQEYGTVAASPVLSEILNSVVSTSSFDFNLYHGTLWSVDALFCETEDAIRTWISYGANSVDMESSIVYLLGKLFNLHTISILGISDLPDSLDWNFQKTNKIHPKYETILDNAIDVLTQMLPEIQKKVIN